MKNEKLYKSLWVYGLKGLDLLLDGELKMKNEKLRSLDVFTGPITSSKVNIISLKVSESRSLIV